MNRTRIIAMTLCILLLAAAGAGVAAAKQEENPRQAGESSVYFYDVAASDAHGKGTLMIDVDRHTFVFNGQGFTPSAQIELRARAVGDTDYVVFASGRTTPSGNLHIAGTWEADAAPPGIVAGYPQVAEFSLLCQGGFVTKIACYYSTDGGVTWEESDHSEGIALGQVKFVELGDLGVPEGALVKMHAIVVWGKDRTGSEVFVYDKYSWWYADYWIRGTTLNPTLNYSGTGLLYPPY